MWRDYRRQTARREAAFGVIPAVPNALAERANTPAPPSECFCSTPHPLRLSPSVRRAIQFSRRIAFPDGPFTARYSAFRVSGREWPGYAERFFFARFGADFSGKRDFVCRALFPCARCGVYLPRREMLSAQGRAVHSSASAKKPFVKVANPPIIRVAAMAGKISRFPARPLRTD